jgi:hypothetical protein
MLDDPMHVLIQHIAALESRIGLDFPSAFREMLELMKMVVQ